MFLVLMAFLLERIMRKTVIALALISVSAEVPAMASQLPENNKNSTAIEVRIDQSGRPIVSGAKIQSFDERVQLAATTSPKVKNGLCGFHCRKAPGEGQA